MTFTAVKSFYPRVLRIPIIGILLGYYGLQLVGTYATGKVLQV